jgi:hypothetical protein
MTLARLLEVLRSPEGVGSGAPVAVADPAPAIAIAPLAVDPAPAAAAEQRAEPAAPAPAEEAAPAVAPIAEIPPGLLSQALSRAELKALAQDTPAPAQGAPISGDPAPIAADAGAVPATQGKVAEARPLPPKTYAPFKLPDGYTQTAEGLKQFTDIIGPEQVSQDAAQKLMDLAIAEMARAVERDRVEQGKFWPAMNEKWIAETRKYFGKRLLTALTGAKALIEQYAASPEDARAMIDHMKANGMENFLPFLRFLDKLASPEVLNVLDENQFVAAHAAPQDRPQTVEERWYGNPPKSAGA